MFAWNFEANRRSVSPQIHIVTFLQLKERNLKVLYGLLSYLQKFQKAKFSPEISLLS